MDIIEKLILFPVGAMNSYHLVWGRVVKNFRMNLLYKLSKNYRFSGPFKWLKVKIVSKRMKSSR